MKRLLLLAPALLCAFTYGYKNNPQTGKPDMVATGADTSDISGLSTGYVKTAHFNDYSTARAAEHAALGTAAYQPLSAFLGVSDQAADSAKLGGTLATTVVAGAAAGATAVQPSGSISGTAGGLSGTPAVNVASVASIGAITASSTSSQFSSSIATRGQKNAFEWGHPNTSGYGNTLGYFGGAGKGYIALHGSAGSSGDTFKTQSVYPSIMVSDLAGGFIFGTVPALNTDNQTMASYASLPASGNFAVNGTLSAAAGGSTNHTVCWKSGGVLGYCSTVVATDGSCTCN